MEIAFWMRWTSFQIHLIIEHIVSVFVLDSRARFARPFRAPVSRARLIDGYPMSQLLLTFEWRRMARVAKRQNFSNLWKQLPKRPRQTRHFASHIEVAKVEKKKKEQILLPFYYLGKWERSALKRLKMSELEHAITWRMKMQLLFKDILPFLAKIVVNSML